MGVSAPHGAQMAAGLAAPPVSAGSCGLGPGGQAATLH